MLTKAIFTNAGSKRLAGMAMILLLLLSGSLISLPRALPGSHSSAVSHFPVRARHGIVASANEISSSVGTEIMRRGGNAVDAAVAVALALAVTYPVAGNLGGGGFMLIRMNDGRAIAIDYRETAPAKATRNMYLDKDGKPISDASTVGYLAAGIPGTVAGLSTALAQYGTMKWQDVIEPARRLAAEGFPVSNWHAFTLRNNRDLVERFPQGHYGSGELLAKFPESRRIFLNDGKFYQEGDLFKQPELAETLARLQKDGPREFYEGRTAELIVADMKANHGIITMDDLKSYKPVLREPLRGDYRGYQILTMPPPSSGGIALLEMLNILEHYDLRAMGDNSSQKYHLLAETMRRAFADRAEFLGDPDFVKLPVAGLISKRYAAEIAKSIDLNRAASSASVKHGNPIAYESDATTHFTVVDAAGNAVANTYTLNGNYGSGATVAGTGILLNNEMDDFAAKPGLPNDYGLIQGEANAVAANKRPLSSMTPTIVLKDGKLCFAIGSPGGPTIINTVLQVILNVIDFNMNIQQAVDAPRIHHQWLPDAVVYEPHSMARDVVETLRAKGHKISEQIGYMGSAQGVMIEPETGMRLGGSDSRAPDGRAVGY